MVWENLDLWHMSIMFYKVPNIPSLIRDSLCLACCP